MNSLYKWTLLLLLIIISSCNKDEAIDENPLEQPVVAEVGVKSFGRGLNSFDEGVRIFKTTEGYISFEIYNKVMPKPTYEGDSDIVIRKVNEQFELIEEHILDTDFYEQLNDVTEIEEGKYAIISRTLFVDPFEGPFLSRLSVPTIRIVNDKGETLNSQPLGDFEPLSFYLDAEVSYKNGRFYVNIPNKNSSGNAVQSIIAFDLELNEIWKNEIALSDEIKGGNIYVGNELYYINPKKGAVENTWSFILSRFNPDNGELIESIEYLQENTKSIIVKKVNQGQNALVVVGSFVDSFGVTDWSQSFFTKINMDNWSQEVFTVVDGNPNLGNNIRPNNIAAIGNEFIVNNTIQGTFDAVKIDSNGEIIWTANTGGGYVNDIIINSDGSITFLGSIGNNEDFSRQVMLGTFDANGELK